MPLLGKIDDRLVLDVISLVLSRAVNDRADWNFHYVRFGTAAVFVFAFAMRAPLRADQGLKKQSHQTRGVMVGLKNDIPAPAAIAAIGSTVWNKFFPAETATPVAAIAGFGMDADLVDKLHLRKVPAAPHQVESELSPRWREKLVGDTFSA